jgi:hypothetical protein
LHIGARELVKRAERLVEQQRAGLAGEAAGQRDTLRHTARQLPRCVMMGMPETHLGERGTDALAPRGTRQVRLTGKAESERNVSFDGQPRQQARILEGERYIGTWAANGFTVNQNPAARGLLQTRDDAQ